MTSRLPVEKASSARRATALFSSDMGDLLGVGWGPADSTPAAPRGARALAALGQAPAKALDLAPVLRIRRGALGLGEELAPLGAAGEAGEPGAQREHISTLLPCPLTKQ